MAAGFERACLPKLVEVPAESDDLRAVHRRFLEQLPDERLRFERAGHEVDQDCIGPPWNGVTCLRDGAGGEGLMSGGLQLIQD